MAQKHGGTAGPTAQQKIHDATISEGQSEERANQRVNEYNYAIKQGLNPDRAEQFAQSLQWNDTPKKVVSEEEKKQLAENYAAIPIEERRKGGVFLVTDPQEFANGYAEARAMGMDEDDAYRYGRSQPAVRATMRAGQWLEPKWRNLKVGILSALGARDSDSQGNPYHVSVEEAADAPLVATLFGQTRQDYAFNTYKDASWVDKHLGKKIGTAQAALDNLIAGFTTPEMAAIEIASAGTGTIEGMLPEVGESLTVGARATRFTQRAIKTTSKLAHAGFTAQMAQGTVESGIGVGQSLYKGDTDSAITYTVNGIVNGLMSYGGMRSIDAHAEFSHAIDETTSKVYPDKKFAQLSDKQQALMIQRLIDDDPRFKEAADASEKQMQKNARRLQQRYSEALSQTWNPNAAQRVVTDLHAERAETARKEQVQRVVDTIKAKVQERTGELRKQAEESAQFIGARQTAIQDARAGERKEAAVSRANILQTAEEIAKGREETFASRQAVGELPTEEQTSRSVEAECRRIWTRHLPGSILGRDQIILVSETDGEKTFGLPADSTRS